MRVFAASLSRQPMVVLIISNQPLGSVGPSAIIVWLPIAMPVYLSVCLFIWLFVHWAHTSFHLVDDLSTLDTADETVGPCRLWDLPVRTNEPQLAVFIFHFLGSCLSVQSGQINCKALIWTVWRVRDLWTTLRIETTREQKNQRRVKVSERKIQTRLNDFRFGIYSDTTFIHTHTYALQLKYWLKMSEPSLRRASQLVTSLVPVKCAVRLLGFQ